MRLIYESEDVLPSHLAQCELLTWDLSGRIKEFEAVAEYVWNRHRRTPKEIRAGVIAMSVFRDIFPNMPSYPWSLPKDHWSWHLSVNERRGKVSKTYSVCLYCGSTVYSVGSAQCVTSCCPNCGAPINIVHESSSQMLPYLASYLWRYSGVLCPIRPGVNLQEDVILFR